MNVYIRTNNWLLPSDLRMQRAGIVMLVLCWALSSTTYGQIYVTNYGIGTVSQYDATTGATLNASFITGLASPEGIALYGGSLFIGDRTLGRIGKYDANTGSAINNSFIGGLDFPMGIAVSDGNLFVATSSGIYKYNASTGALLASITIGASSASYIAVGDGFLFAERQGMIAKYNSATLTTVSTSFITGLTQPAGIALSGGTLYVTNYGNNTIGKYDASTGAAVNATFITGGALSQPAPLAFSGGNLYVVNQGNSTLGVYNATTGATVDASFITGLNYGVEGIAVASAIPEPSTYAAVFGIIALGAGAYQRRRRHGP